MDKKETWLITGCSSGLGEQLALEALEQGKNVVVTARDTAKLAHFAQKFPGTALIAQLDVTDNESIANAVKKAVEKFGRIDVLVNNAGYCLRGAIEECTDEEILRQFDTNVFGLARVTRHTLPIMRKQGEGTIVNYSSIAALDPAAGSAFYAATKAAVEGISGGLKKEAAPLGIRVLVIEPGPFSTDFFNRSLDLATNSLPDYAETAGKRKVRLQNPEKLGSGWGDTRKAAKAVFQAVEMKDGPDHLLLGSNALGRAEKELKSRMEEIEKFRDLSISTD